MLEMQDVSLALARTEANTGKRIAASIAITAITTRSSTSVKAADRFAVIPGCGLRVPGFVFGCSSLSGPKCPGSTEFLGPAWRAALSPASVDLPVQWHCAYRRGERSPMVVLLTYICITLLSLPF